MTFKEFLAEARFDVSGATARMPRLPQRQGNVPVQTYPVQTATRPTNISPSIDSLVSGLLAHPMNRAFSQPVQATPQQATATAPAVTQRNVATTSYPVQRTAPTQVQQTGDRNGQLTPQELKPVGKYAAGPSGAKQWYGNTAFLSPRAADAFLAAQQAYGAPIPINSAYRNLEHQSGLSREGHKVVGQSGKSRHGLGMAIDLQKGTQHYNWFMQNGPKFGWHYASIPGDPYHFEFRG